MTVKWRLLLCLVCSLTTVRSQLPTPLFHRSTTTVTHTTQSTTAGTSYAGTKFSLRFCYSSTILCTEQSNSKPLLVQPTAVVSIESSAQPVDSIHRRNAPSNRGLLPSLGIPRQDNQLSRTAPLTALFSALNHLIPARTVTCTTTDVTTGYLSGTFTRTITVNQSIPYPNSCINSADLPYICVPQTKMTLPTRLTCN